ncbi:vitamin K epoxide reductase family protein [Microbacterium sp. NPDC055910]|uniref:vitamin K epoxide reductase family protein n=1 Tax=Microbacterium sp. NPDC055910 TaxID=3345659 RepID=UPI0035D53CF3
MPPSQTHTRPTVLAVWLIIAGAIGWWAAFSLTLAKLDGLANPGAAAACDISVLVQCSANLDAWQGRIFGFPNPLLGLACWVAPIAVGVAILARARFARWFWLLFWAGTAFAFGFVIWLIGQSIYAPNLHTLCPWCMVTWAVTIPTFYVVTLHVLRSGVLAVPAGVRRTADKLMAWVPLATILSYALVLLLAQIEMNAVVSIVNSLF